ncbi:MAG: 5-(aminomethyl)-3-furanmethanol phosphate kinase [Euryarchaeota archaeon]|nr:5-(aminomethyl)-3-furanmethanol phosphate kinase [Euryarchaeota archaeon]
MKSVRVVVKVGGSLIQEAPELVNRLVKEFGSGSCEVDPDKLTSERISFSIFIVPGGGIFADAVRRADKKFGLGDDAAHWMAILGMEQYACYLQDKSHATGTDSITELPQGVSILFPYRLLKAEDPLLHSWDVTSDTIAAWVAKQIGALFIKATDVDGIFREGKLSREIFTSDLPENFESCIDPALPGFLQKNKMECLIINGKFPERVIEAVYGKPVPCTLVKGNI